MLKNNVAKPSVFEPGKSAKDYVESIADREIAWLSQYASPKPIAVSGCAIGYGKQKTPEECIKLLKRYLAVVLKFLPDDTELIRPQLWHRDIHDANIFVQDGRITSVIDWQSIWIGPLLLQARTPRLVDYHGEIQLRLPEGYDKLVGEEREKVADRVERSLQMYFYEDETAKVNPLLNRVFRQPYGKTLSHLVAFAGSLWDGDIVRLRDTLITIER